MVNGCFGNFALGTYVPEEPKRTNCLSRGIIYLTLSITINYVARDRLTLVLPCNYPVSREREKKDMEITRIRNFAIVSQSGSGKTSLAEAMLFTAKAVKKLGRVDDGTSTLDFEPEEIKRKISISAAFHMLNWKKSSLFLMDTPGEDNFLHETIMALRVADSCLFVADAVDPVKPQTRKVWSLVADSSAPTIMFLNKLDRERADFNKALDALRDALGLRLVPVTLPMGSQEDFRGIVDLIQMKAFEFSADGKKTTVDIPGDMADEVEEQRSNLIEYAAESDEELLEKFLEGEELSPEEIISGLRQGIIDGGFIPVVCGSATKNIGASTVLDHIVQFLPSPGEKEPAAGTNPETGDEVTREPKADAPFSGLVFKTLTDPYAGRLSIMRIYSGTLTPDGMLLNANKKEKEKYGQVFFLNGKNQEPAQEALPGCIVAIAKLKSTQTGDTLCDPANPVVYPFVEFPNPVITYTLKPKSRGDEEKITNALARLREEDPTIKVSRNAETNELLISGQGQIHIDATIEKMKRKFGVSVDLTTPKIAYRETIKAPKKGVIYRHKKQTGGAGQFAEVHFDITPLPRGEGYEFEEALVGMNVPRNFVPAVEKGIQEAMQSGPLAGYPVTDIKIRFYDGKSHEVDSSEMAFKIAAIQCFKKGVLEAKPTLLEPIVKITVTVPEESVGDIIGDLNSRRGKVMGMEPGDGVQTVTALVPLSEVQKYVLDLNAMTAGQGTFTVEPSHYEEVPPNLTEKIVAEAKQGEDN